jgi:hypothetical protein
MLFYYVHDVAHYIFLKFILYYEYYITIEMGGACSAYEGGERRVQGFGGKI